MLIIGRAHTFHDLIPFKKISSRQLLSLDWPGAIDLLINCACALLSVRMAKTQAVNCSHGRFSGGLWLISGAGVRR
jgi:hypothetical protein